MNYCNEGYAILSYVVDQVAGMPLEQFCMECIFCPLGMTLTVLDDDCAAAQAMSGGNITSLFERDDDGALLCDDNWSILPPFRGCAMVKSMAPGYSGLLSLFVQWRYARGAAGSAPRGGRRFERAVHSGYGNRLLRPRPV